MPPSPQFIDHVCELLGPQGRILARRMFGGHGLYCDGLFIGIISNEVLYLKTDETSRAEFENAGGYAFTYQRAGKTARLAFHATPEDAMESPADIAPWARLAIQAALRARKPAPAGKPRPARGGPPRAPKRRP